MSCAPERPSARIGERRVGDESEKPIAVYGATAVNILIAGTKYAAAIVTGSSAMLSEAIHSTVDTANELLLLLGVKRSRKPPDADHPYGHGKELYFWGLIVAVVIFGFGGGMSIYEGLLHISHPRVLTNVGWSYAVLATSAVFEGVSWFIAFRELSRSMRKRSFWEALHASKDPAVFCVIAEDSAALVGIAVAFLGIFLSEALGVPALDGVASLMIGLVLTVTAVFLVYESRGLLIGEAARPEVVRDILALAEADPAVAHVQRPLSMHLGPREILVNMEVEFRSGLSAADLVLGVDRLERRIRAAHPEIKRVFIEAEALAAAGARTPVKDGGTET
jgi:cation diffusion facilitator family transporter